MAEQEKENITITISKEINNILEDGDYNKSKLINKLLTKHFEEQ